MQTHRIKHFLYEQMLVDQWKVIFRSFSAKQVRVSDEEYVCFDSLTD